MSILSNGKIILLKTTPGSLRRTSTLSSTSSGSSTRPIPARESVRRREKGKIRQKFKRKKSQERLLPPILDAIPLPKKVLSQGRGPKKKLLPSQGGSQKWRWRYLKRTHPNMKKLSLSQVRMRSYLQSKKVEKGTSKTRMENLYQCLFRQQISKRKKRPWKR